MIHAVKTAIPLPVEQLEAFCQAHDIIRLELFGSILREDFRAESDVDFLVMFAPDRPCGLFELFRLEDALSDLLKRPVQLTERMGVEEMRNTLRRDEILRTVRVLYDEPA
ncbi:MAG: nucleotidyltransferase domain-containing protein [bacterium]